MGEPQKHGEAVAKCKRDDELESADAYLFWSFIYSLRFENVWNFQDESLFFLQKEDRVVRVEYNCHSTFFDTEKTISHISKKSIVPGIPN